MSYTWAKTKILVYNKNEQESDEKYEEMIKLQRLGIEPKENDIKTPEKVWTDYAFCVDHILDFFEDVDKIAGGGTKILTIDGRSFTIKAKFM